MLADGRTKAGLLKQPPSLPPIGKHRPYDPSGKTLGMLLLLPSLLVIGVVIIYPLVYTVFISFFNKDLLNPGSVPFVGLKNYATLLGAENFRLAFKNSVMVTALAVTIQMVLAFALALLLHKPFKGRGLVRGILILPWALPTFVAAFAWIWMLDYNYGIVNHLLEAVGLSRVAWLGQPGTAYLAIVAANIWKGLPWTLVVLMAGLELVPQELSEAARVDGASWWDEIRHVILPSMSAVISVTVVLRTIWTFNWFDLIYLMTGGGPARSTLVLPIEVYKTAFTSYKMGLASAIGSIMFVVLGLFSVFYFRLHGNEEADAS